RRLHLINRIDNHAGVDAEIPGRQRQHDGADANTAAPAHRQTPTRLSAAVFDIVALTAFSETHAEYSKNFLLRTFYYIKKRPLPWPSLLRGHRARAAYLLLNLRYLPAPPQRESDCR